MPTDGTVRFGVIGLDHPHIYQQCEALVRGGAEFALFQSDEPALAPPFAARFPMARQVSDARAILEAPDIALVASAAVPGKRAGIGIAAMRHGKDFLSDKPAFTTLEALAEARRVQAETGRIFAVLFGERFESAATVRALELARAGAIGRVVQTIGLGPHRLNAPARPPWFFRRALNGGILNDIASHQIDQFLVFTGSTNATIALARTANRAHPQFPEFDDFGELLIDGRAGTSGYVRVDWFTPDGLSTWGDGRLTVLGTEGFIEVRKYCDLAGRPGADHLFLVDGRETRYIDCARVALPFGPALVRDVRERSETAVPQAHTFLVSELAVKAELAAARLEPLGA